MKRYWGKAVILGIFLGVLSALSIELFSAFIFIWGISYYIRLKYPANESGFISSAFMWGVALRILFILLYYYFFLFQGRTDVLGPDGESYQARGWYISRLLTGGDIMVAPGKEQIFRDYASMAQYYNLTLPDWHIYQVGLFSYIIGVIYSAMNYVPLLIKFINAIVSCVTAVLVYELAREVFSVKVARATLIAVMFLPTMFMFSLTSMRDPLINLCLILIVLSAVKFQRNKRPFYIITMVISVILLSHLKVSAVAQVALFLSMSVFLWSGMRMRRKVFILFFISLLALSSGYMAKLAGHLSLDKLTNPHIGYVNTPGNNYRILPDDFYTHARDINTIRPHELLLAVIKGSLHALFEPFPTSVASKGELLGMAQSLPWILFSPFVLLGIVYALRHASSEKRRQCMHILAYLFVFTGVLAIAEGNVGTVFRHRDMVMPYFIIFGMAGIYHIFIGSEGA